MKKLLFFLLFACYSCANLFAANSGECGNGLYWEYDNGTLSIYGGGSMNDYSSSNPPWYSKRGSIRYISVSSAEYIGKCAFAGCSADSVYIGSRTTNIGNSAFLACGRLKKVKIYSNDLVKKSYSEQSNLGTIFGSQVTTYIIGSNVNTIGECAFYNCSNITSITFNNTNNIKINSKAFMGCTGLQTIDIPKISTIGTSAFANCTNLVTIEISNVSHIFSSAFTGCTSLINIDIPNVFDIGSSTFLNCTSLTSISIPSRVLSIEKKTFSGCTNLSNVSLSKNITSIGDSAFYNCRTLSSITIPNKVTNIGNYAFANCMGFTAVTVPNTVISIGEYAFQNCENIIAITIPQQVSTIGRGAFINCNNLTSVVLNSNAVAGTDYTDTYNLESIFGEQVRKYVIGNNVNKVGEYAFSHCDSVRSISISDNVTSVGKYAFFYCYCLDTVSLGNISTIQPYTFAGCKNLSSITIPSSVQEINIKAFTSCDSLKTITLNSNKIVSANYDRDTGFKSIFGAQVEKYFIGTGAERIGNYAFYNCSNITTITLPESITAIGEGAFGYCSKMSSFSLPNHVNEIGPWAFNSCVNLPTITFPETVTSIGEGAFHKCKQITSIVLPVAITTIEDKAFEACTNLCHVSLSDSTISIGNYAFNECYKLHRITIPEKVRSIGYYAFWSTGLDSIICERSTPALLEREFFTGIKDNFPYSINLRIFVPCKTRSEYQRSWTDYADKIYYLSENNCSTAYDITFVNWDGTELLTLSEVEEGTIPEYTGATPTRPETAEFTYTFAGWNPEIVAATSDRTYTATYTATRRSYIITWLNEDGSLIDQTTVEYGQTPTHANPTKAATAEYTYTFAGWTPKVVAATGDATYKASFTATKNKYLIVFQDEDGTELKSGQVEYGEMPIAPAAPSKPADSEYIYTFAGWTPKIVIVTKEATYTATYDVTPVSEGVENVSSGDIAPRKVMIDSNVYILRGEKVYTLQGQEVREWK